MIFDKARNWPHPVLSPLCDDISPSEFAFDLDCWPDHPKWRLKVDTKHSDATLRELVELRKACYLFHLECKRTYFREAFKSNETGFEVSVSGDQLFGVVEASLFVVATQDITSYRHPGQHKDYRDVAFGISIGEPLAVAVSRSFEAPLEADPILKLSSILDIRKGNEDVRFMRVNCEGERILLELPPVEFESYRNLRADPSLRGLLASTVILPGLLQSFHYLRDPHLDLGEFKASHSWSRRVVGRLEELGIDLRVGDDGGDVCLQAAQQLLRGPLRRSLEDLITIFSTR